MQEVSTTKQILTGIAIFAGVLAVATAVIIIQETRQTNARYNRHQTAKR